MTVMVMVMVMVMMMMMIMMRIGLMCLLSLLNAADWVEQL